MTREEELRLAAVAEIVAQDGPIRYPRQRPDESQAEWLWSCLWRCLLVPEEYRYRFSGDGMRLLETYTKIKAAT